ncbi:MAG: hypothetical protein IJY15_03755, partial [Thermoguttaceae bacterium]|nr:hypothetical protein [Thermoguttaceae bacterium]
MCCESTKAENVPKKASFRAVDKKNDILSNELTEPLDVDISIFYRKAKIKRFGKNQEKFLEIVRTNRRQAQKST